MVSKNFSVNYYDISCTISSKFAVFPGDIPFSSSLHSSITNGDSCTLSSITSTLHIGSHADAPSHYNANGNNIANRDLAYYFGECQVIDMTKTTNPQLSVEDFINVPILAKRVLLKTNSWQETHCWSSDFCSLSVDVVHYLSTKNVILIGIDTPSIDHAKTKHLIVHHTIYNYDMAVLECLRLYKVPAGCYGLIALPLAIEEGDASPVRAILLPNNTIPELAKNVE